jgi:hypothetical protein
LFDKSNEVVFLGNITPNSHGTAALSDDPADDLIGRTRIPVVGMLRASGNGYRGAFSGESFGDGRAESSTRAGDDCDPIGEARRTRCHVGKVVQQTSYMVLCSLYPGQLRLPGVEAASLPRDGERANP